MEEGSDPPEKEKEKEITQKMEQGSDPPKEEETTKIEDEGKGPQEKDPEKMEGESDPEPEEKDDPEKEKETTLNMEGERNPEKKETTQKMEGERNPEKEKETTQEEPEEEENSQDEEESEVMDPRMMPVDPESLDANWRSRLSSLEVPDKYKRFCQLACDERLPFRVKDPIWGLDCPCCGEEVETSMHCLWECCHAKAVWSMSPLWSGVVQLSSSTFREFFRDVMRVLEDDRNLSLFVLICWSLLEARNDHVQQLIAPDLAADCYRAAAIMEKAMLLHEKTSKWAEHKSQIPVIAEMDRRGLGKWNPPPRGWLKMNVEAKTSEHMIAMGAVVRNENGGFLAALSSCYKPAAIHLMVAKASALRRALSWAETGAMMHHHSKVVVELTSNLIVNSVASTENSTWRLCDELRVPVEDCLVIASRFRAVQFAYVNPDENSLAHCLASLAIHQGFEGSWVATGAPDRFEETVIPNLPR